MDKIGIMICGHGSRSKSAEEEFGLLAKGLKKHFVDIQVDYGFLESSAPNIHMGLDSLRDHGVNHIIAVPGMLFAATHAKNDIPSVLTTYQEKNPGLRVSYGRELGLHSEMIAAFEARILDCLNLSHVDDGDLYDTMLVVVGRGTSDTYANAEAAKLTRIVSENLGFGWSETVYSGVTFPSVGQGLEMALKLGYKKPIFLKISPDEDNKSIEIQSGVIVEKVVSELEKKNFTFKGKKKFKNMFKTCFFFMRNFGRCSFLFSGVF